LDMPAKAIKVYKDMERDLIAMLDAGEVIASNAGVATYKCRQIANGGIYIDSTKNIWENLHSIKAELVLNLVEELQGKPLFVAYDTNHDKARLLDVLGDDTSWIGGGVSTKRAKEIEKKWNAGKLPVLLAQPSSVSHGLNFQGGRAICWHSMTWNYEEYDQFIKRVLRQGQQYDIMMHRLLMRGTIDEVLVRAMEIKSGRQNRFLAALRTYYLEQ